MQELLQHNLHYAKQQMKLQADKKRTERTFTPGEEVFIKLQPYVQSSVARRNNHKLSFKYFGPYKINRSINPVAYEVTLPADSKIHPVFHVSHSGGAGGMHLYSSEYPRFCAKINIIHVHMAIAPYTSDSYGAGD